MSIKENFLSKNVKRIGRGEKNNIDKLSKQHISKKNTEKKGLNKSEKKEDKSPNVKKEILVSKQNNNNELYNNKNNKKIGKEENRKDNNTTNNMKINENGRELASISNLVNENSLIEDYINYVYKTLKDNIYYPKLALRRGLEGTVYVEFLITYEGEIKNIKIAKSSGFKVLDEAGIKIAKKCSPLKKPPQEIKLHAPIVFKLR
jgi:protein TonB